MGNSHENIKSADDNGAAQPECHYQPVLYGPIQCGERWESKEMEGESAPSYVRLGPEPFSFSCRLT